MTWLTCRQLRAPFLIVIGGVALAVAMLVLTGPGMADEFRSSGVATCQAGDQPDVGTLTCGDLERQYLGRHGELRAIGPLLAVLPALVGAFWGAPLVARELEQGTHRLAWVQGITRSRWLGAKLGVVGAVAIGATAVVSVAFTWWVHPSDRLSGRIDPGTFAQRGIVPIAYVAFAFGLGAVLGAVVRRTLPAMAATVGAFVAVRIGVQGVIRPKLLSATVLRYPTFSFHGDDPEGLLRAEQGWVLSTRTLDGSGRVVSSGGTIRDDAAARLCGLGRITPDKAQLDACGDQLGLVNVVRVLPADRFWMLQLLEAALFLGLALLLVGACFWWVRRRLV
jgi:hypothetical protein